MTGTDTTTRRRFLKAAIGSSAIIALGGRTPRFLLEAAALDAETPSSSETVLVVVQLSGGNDGLNTIVPHADDEYRKSRPSLAISEASVLRIDDYCGFHPSLRGFAGLLEEGKLAIVQGVGYPDPNRSHFESMDIWHTGYQGDKPKTAGWLGRYLDATADVDGHEVPALHFGAEQQPLALTGRRVHVPSVRSLEQFRLQSDADDFPAVLGPLVATARPSESPLLGFVQTSSAAALAASQRVSARVHAYDAKANYADSPLAQKLRMVARLIDAELGTRIFYVELDGFDTHSRQADAHAGLLRQLGDAASAFITDVSAHGHGERVLLIAFSEFGRRVQENASAGTDHGAAAPMFVAGARIAPGLIGGHPSLQDLDDGDLKHHTDFRRVYATVLEDWLHWSSEPVLGKRFERLPLILT